MKTLHRLPTLRLPRFVRVCRPGFLGALVVGCACLGITTRAPAQAAPKPSAMPVRGLHMSAPAKRDLSAFTNFVRTVLQPQGVNTLILEFNYGFDYHSRPEFANPAGLGSNEVQQLARVCQAAGLELIPQINCLGHQSWQQRVDKLLQKHPEFDEAPGKNPEYCRSYCPLHPDVHPVLFDLMDELARACGAKSFHVGMDEVFVLADPDCPRCKGKTAAELFATEVKALHSHLQQLGCRMWMWGDRFLDGKATGIGKWEASLNGTHPAVDQVPKDIVICDWHYDKAHPTAQFFVSKGFAVVECPWRKPAVALGQWEQIKALRESPDRPAADRALGLVQTTWCGFSPFLQACNSQPTNAVPARTAPAEAANCFQALFKAVREGK
jgi:hypothetical protein